MGCKSLILQEARVGFSPSVVSRHGGIFVDVYGGRWDHALTQKWSFGHVLPKKTSGIRAYLQIVESLAVKAQQVSLQVIATLGRVEDLNESGTNWSGCCDLLATRFATKGNRG